MFETYRKELSAYTNSRWARQIFLWSSILLFIGSFVFWTGLGFGNQNGGSGTAGAKVATILSLVIAVPAILVFNVAVALIWAFVQTAIRSLSG